MPAGKAWVRSLFQGWYDIWTWSPEEILHQDHRECPASYRREYEKNRPEFFDKEKISADYKKHRDGERNPAQCTKIHHEFKQPRRTDWNIQIMGLPQCKQDCVVETECFPFHCLVCNSDESRTECCYDENHYRQLDIDRSQLVSENCQALT